MSNIKKVQTEADRLLKKVNEGLEAYDELHDKLANAPNASAKERLEGDLKRELKKLQRHREAMKAFMQNDDYKEKTKMQQSRKRIEERMESFRAIEREMKTKAFSNEGLASAALEKAESPTEQWLKEAIEEGRKKIELLEYEAQKAGGGRVRRGKTQQKSDYQIRLEKLHVHFYKWEALLRMVTNEEVDTDEVDELQEQIQKVLEDDAEMEVMENMSIYDNFDIAEPKAKPTVPFDTSDNDKATSSRTTTKAKTPLSTVQTKASPVITSPKDAAAVSAKPTPAAAPAPVVAAPTPTPATAPTPSAATAAPATPASPPSVRQASSSSPLERDPATAAADEAEAVPEWMDDDVDAANDDTFGDDAMAGAGGLAVGSLAEMASATSKVAKDWERQKPASPQELKSAKLGEGAAAVEEKTKTPTPTPNAWEKRAAEQRAAELLRGQKAQQQQQQQASGSATPASPASPQSATAAGAAAVPAPAAAAPTAASPVVPAPPASTPVVASPVAAAATPASPAAAASSTVSPVAAAAAAAGVPAVVIPATLSESTSPMPAPAAATTAAAGGPQFRYPTKRINELLDMSLGNLPHTLDVQRQRTYEPPNAIDPIPYFPQEVLPVLSNKNVYHQMDLDTLFFIFYYHQKSYQQYFAAKELKARSYRYHTKQQRWYQRLERPQSTTETEERGAYTFFDFEEKWDHDRTDDFLFEYKYLENELN